VTIGARSCRNPAVSEGVLYIFQFPAMMGRRIGNFQDTGISLWWS